MMVPPMGCSDAKQSRLNQTRNWSSDSVRSLASLRASPNILNHFMNNPWLCFRVALSGLNRFSLVAAPLALKLAVCSFCARPLIQIQPEYCPERQDHDPADHDDPEQ